MYKILVVDDESIEREGISFLIEKYKFPLEVAQATNGKTALSFMLHAVCPSPLLLQNYFPRKSRTSAVALARTSSSSTYSQTASFWLRNQVSWRLA